MSVFSYIYTFVIGPLELLFEFLFTLGFRFFRNPGFSIIGLSFVINLMILPLYKKADEMQSAQRELEQSLSPWVSHIKKAFSGDEQYMMLQTYYRQHHYRPIYALRGMVSLLLEIPFFMAAYHMLSSQNLLHDYPFWIIADLGAPDRLLTVAGISINLLPILMTAISLLNSTLYTSGMPVKSKVQLYAMAIVFLVLLYDSPSGLVLYWTVNNIISLYRTLLGLTKNPKQSARAFSSVMGAAILISLIFLHSSLSLRSRQHCILFAILLQLPMLYHVLSRRLRRKVSKKPSEEDPFIFICNCLFSVILTGILIPSSVIQASPEEFIKVTLLNNPLSYVLSSALLAAGTFLLWFGIFYKLASPAGRHLMSFGTLAMSSAFLLDYMLFGTDMGILSPLLMYEVIPDFPAQTAAVNSVILILVISLLFILWKYKKKHLKALCSIACAAVLLMSGFNVIQTQLFIGPRLKELKGQMSRSLSIPISKDGKNVVILMMDRAISSYIPYIMNEKPELQEQFQGFTYYPNTMSFGAFTNIGTPALFGGYEYTPEEMNRRNQEPLVQKHNEAMKVMPVMFLKEGFQVSVGNPSYAGYQWLPDLSIYDEYPGINAAMSPVTDSKEQANNDHVLDSLLRRNLFCFSLFKTAPVAFQPALYLKGIYNNLNALFPNKQETHSAFTQVCTGNYKSTGQLDSFMSSYRTLQNLPQLTEITDSHKNCFSMMSNDATHEPMLLQVPDYAPAMSVDNTEYEAAHADRFLLNGRQMHMEDIRQIIHYHANMASMIQIGNWLDYLRENDVYDNTRIIIISDHGSSLAQFDDMLFGDEGYQDVMFFNPLLLVKDYGSKEFTVDDQFMTQSDVPTLASMGLVKNPRNPFTGLPIDSRQKQGEQHILMSYDWDVSVNNGSTFLPGYWLSVKNNIFDLDNWKALPDHPLSK